MAFERAFGPIGNEWRDEALASIQEQLQILRSCLGDDSDKEPMPRPRAWAGADEPDESDDEDDGE